MLSPHLTSPEEKLDIQNLVAIVLFAKFKQIDQ